MKPLKIIRKVFSPSSYSKLVRYSKLYGPRWFIDAGKCLHVPDYIIYNEWYKQNKPTTEEIARQRNYKFENTPKISIVVPVYNTPLKYLEQMIQSVQNQTYRNWELCIAHASPDNKELVRKLDEYSIKDNRIKVNTFLKNLGIAENTNKAIELATGDYVAFMDHDDLLPCQSLYEVVKANQDEQHDILYTDEDFITEDLSYKFGPQFKPDWSPHLLECHNYITHFLIVKKSLLDKVGKLISKYDGAQDYDFVLRCTDASKDIYHIPHVLYHWRAHAGSVAGDSESKKYAYEAGKGALEAHFERRHIDAKVEQGNLLGYYQPICPTPGNPLVSIIIPNKDHIQDLSKCLNSIYEKSTYKNFEIIIVENNSENGETFKYYESLTAKHTNITVVQYKGDFNYSAINNLAARSARGEYLLFLNNDTELITADAISQMLGCCMLPEVGAVGAKLLYADDKVQHAGVVLGVHGFAGHAFVNLKKDDPGYANKAQLSYDCGAATGACLLVSTPTFNKVNGFDENLVISLNDVDLCLKISALNKFIVCNNYALWHHYESKSRGYDEKDTKKQKRLDAEVKIFQKKWPWVGKKCDPFHNPNFNWYNYPYLLIPPRRK